MAVVAFDAQRPGEPAHLLEELFPIDVLRKDLQVVEMEVVRPRRLRLLLLNGGAPEDEERE